MSLLHLSDPITKVPLIGDQSASKLHRLTIYTVEDLLHHYPSRYIDRSLVTTISSLQEGESATITAIVVDFKNIFTKFGKTSSKPWLLTRRVKSRSPGSIKPI